MMPVMRAIGILLFALGAGCTVEQPASPGTVTQTISPMVDPSRAGSNRDGAVAPEPPLDVSALKTRLRDTHALGAFTRLALENQADDLLQQFRAHYQSGQKTHDAPLRQTYNMLVLKVLCLVQDGDPPLARSISGAREAIWDLLADPVKFSSVT